MFHGEALPWLDWTRNRPTSSNERRKKEDAPVWKVHQHVTSLEAFVVSVSSELLKRKKISKERARSIKARRRTLKKEIWKF